MTSLLAGAMVASTVGAVFGYLWGKRFSEEPPIRVKGGGSIFLHVLSNTVKWEEDDAKDKKNWHLSIGAKGRNDYRLIIVVADTNGNCYSKTVFGSRVTVHFGQHSWVELKPNPMTNKTELKSNPKDLKENQSDKRQLKHPDDLSEIKVDGRSQYDPSQGKFEEMLLLDW